MLADIVSKNGCLLLNIGPQADGRIPDTAKDIRFTTKDGVLYAIALDWPKDGKLTVSSLASTRGKAKSGISKVTLPGHAGDLKWKQTTKGLVVTLPENYPCEYAFSLKIEGAKLASGGVQRGEGWPPFLMS